MLETRVDALSGKRYLSGNGCRGFDPKEKNAGQVYRYIDQVCFFEREGQKQNYYGSDRWKTGAERISGIAVAAV